MVVGMAVTMPVGIHGDTMPAVHPIASNASVLTSRPSSPDGVAERFDLDSLSLTADS